MYIYGQNKHTDALLMLCAFVYAVIFFFFYSRDDYFVSSNCKSIFRNLAFSLNEFV